MVFLSNLDFSLPFTNPVIIFTLVLFIILFAPILFNKIKVPYLIGLIVAGIIVGPYGLNLLLRDSSIVLFGTVGLLYIMFLAGLEIDLSEFKKNKGKIIFFGLATFLLPLIIGAFASYYILGYGLLSSILLASMFSTHTLISYPITSKKGVSRNKAVAIAVGATLITDVLALLILAVIAGMTKEEVSSTFWITLGASSIIFAGIIFFVFPPIIRWFFKNNQDSISQFIFVLAIVFLGAFLAEAAGIEAIIGAFFAGLVLNKFIPHSSPLMNRIDFVGNALFIPFFLIGVGMLVNFNVLFQGWGALRVAGVIVVVALLTKFIAAWITQKAFKMSSAERSMIFGLTTSHAAATLAIILVGYNIIIGETPEGLPIRLLDEDILNGTILLILISCAISSFVVEKASTTIAEKEEKDASNDLISEDKILISLASIEAVPEMIDFGIMLKSKNKNIPIYALNIMSDDNIDESSEFKSKKLMEAAIKQASASENTINPLTRYDMNVSNAIIYTIKEQKITDVIIGLHKGSTPKDFLGSVTEDILAKTEEIIYIYKYVQPFNTLKRMVVAVVPSAEKEAGFAHWFSRINSMAKSGGLTVQYFANEATIEQLKELNLQSADPYKVNYSEFTDWKDFLILGRELKQNDLFTIISSRKNHLSYTPALERLGYYLSRYFKSYSFIIIYPQQEINGDKTAFTDADSSILDSLSDNLKAVNKAGRNISKWFKWSR